MSSSLLLSQTACHLENVLDFLHAATEPCTVSGGGGEPFSGDSLRRERNETRIQIASGILVQCWQSLLIEGLPPPSAHAFSLEGSCHSEPCLLSVTSQIKRLGIISVDGEMEDEPI